jgi:hypothetical protein
MKQISKIEITKKVINNTKDGKEHFNIKETCILT